jgi:KaiC/GvpD/RAD55 family RecA-like ATPase
MTEIKGNGRELPKCPTGIQGLDEVTGGGVPLGRPTLVCGAAGCGKTLLAIEFLVRGVTQYGAPGVFLAFEETAKELADNVRSLGFDLDDLIARDQIAVDHVRVERSEIEETAEYDLEGLFIRLGYAIDRIGAKRVVLDTIETLFGGLSDAGILRAELRRLFRWLNARLRILLVDDHGDTVEMLRTILEMEGREVRTAADVATALETAAQTEFDLLLSGLGLPDRSGLDLMRELRARGSTLSGIALSGYGQETDVELSRAAGFSEHIVKPADPHLLLRTIEKVVRQSDAN